MADYLRDFSFDFENDTVQSEDLYSCSLDSTTDSLPEVDEIKTPLLYNSKLSPINHRSILHNLSNTTNTNTNTTVTQSQSQSKGSKQSLQDVVAFADSSSTNSNFYQDFDDNFIELDLNKEIYTHNQLDSSFYHHQGGFNTDVYQVQSQGADSLNSDINEIIQEGSNHLKNNYKLWLSKNNSKLEGVF